MFSMTHTSTCRYTFILSLVLEGRKLNVGPLYFVERKAGLYKSWASGSRVDQILYGGD